MEIVKKSKKELRKLIGGSLRNAINSLELPPATKKVEKLLRKNSRRLAGEFSSLIRKARKKSKKAEKSIASIEQIFEGGKNGKKKSKRGRESKLEPVQD